MPAARLSAQLDKSWGQRHQKSEPRHQSDSLVAVPRSAQPRPFNQLYVIGLDGKGNLLGARFNLLKDSIVSAAMDMNLRILIFQPPNVSSIAMRLPVGCVYGTGKLAMLSVPLPGSLSADHGSS
jgi:hypothetical protein